MAFPSTVCTSLWWVPRIPSPPHCTPCQWRLSGCTWCSKTVFVMLQNVLFWQKHQFSYWSLWFAGTMVQLAVSVLKCSKSGLTCFLRYAFNRVTLFSRDVYLKVSPVGLKRDKPAAVRRLRCDRTWEWSSWDCPAPTPRECSPSLWTDTWSFLGPAWYLLFLPWSTQTCLHQHQSIRDLFILVF